MHEELKEQVTRLLRGDGAHAEYAAVLRRFPPRHAGSRVPGVPHTPWQLLEHMRLAQWDILEFTRNPAHESPPFPAGYWPDGDAPAGAPAWKRAADTFLGELDEMIALVSGSKDPCAPIPHTDGVSLLREALILADHNAYHLGQLVQIRRALEEGSGRSAKGARSRAQ